MLDGVAWFTILSTEHGCVTAYSVDEFTPPPLGSADIMFLTDGINLPDDNNAVVKGQLHGIHEPDAHDCERLQVRSSHRNSGGESGPRTRRDPPNERWLMPHLTA